MKTRTFILTFLMMVCSSVFGQNHWNFNPYDYPENYGIVTTVKIDGTEQQAVGTIEVGAFCGDVVRGSAKIEKHNVIGNFIARLQVYGNTNDVITFKIYNHETGTEYVLSSTETLVLSNTMSDYTAVAPYAIEFNSVAQVESVVYETLPAAIEAAQAGQTVKLLNDVALAAPITFAADDNITLDLNGKDVTYTSSTAGDAMITNNGQLTIIDATGEGKISYEYTGAPDTSYGKGNYTIFNNGILTISAGTVENTTAAMSHASYAINTGAGATLNVQGGKVLNLNSHAVRMVSFGTALNTVNISGGYIEGTRALQVQLPSSAAAAPEMDLNITGGELKSNETTYNLAIYVYSNGQSAEKLSLEIDGGTFNGNIAINAAASNSMNENAVLVEGGTFNGEYGIFSYSEEASAKEVISIVGGTFKTNYAEMYAEDDGYIFVKNGDVYNVEAGSYVAKIGDVKYLTFDEAYKAAKTGDVIELLQTAVITNSKPWINYSNKNITVKAELGTTAFRVQDGAYVWFGGMTIESDDYCITVGASDSSSGATVEIYGGTYYGATTAISVTKGEVNILGGTFKVEPYQGSYEYTINCIDANYKNGTADVSIKGGKFYNFNPQDNAAEGAGTNFLIAKYAAVQENDGYWKVVDAVASITDNGTKYYATLPAAIAAAQAGQTVTLIKDITCEETIVINKDVNIDGDNKTVTSSASRIFRLTTSGIEVVMSDLNLVSTAVRQGTNDIRGISVDPDLNDVELVLNNCSVDFTDASASDWAYAVNVATSNEVTLTINGGTYEGANAINVWGNGHTINIDGTILTSLYEANDIYHGCCVKLEGSGSTLDVANTTFNGEHAVAVGEKTAGANTVNAPLEEGNIANNTDNTKVYVAKNGSNYYYSINTAIEEAQTDATINLLAYDIDEYVNQECNKSITILGAAEWMEGKVTTLTGGMYLGIDNSQCDPNTIVVKGITFEGKGLKIASQENVTVENNIFNNITDGMAITVIGKDIKAVANNNTINVAAGVGIELRNMASATITNNVITNTGHNSVQATAVNADANVTITGNTFENWGTATNAQGQLEGRAVRVSGGANVVVNNNKMINANAPESFVKITKVSGQTAQAIDVDKNYWNGNNPLPLFETDGTNDPVSYIKGYYSDANLTNYIPLTASVAKIGTTYYQTLQAAVDACVVGDNTIEMLAEINEDVTIKQVEGVNVVIEGAEKTFTGTFYIHGNARHDGAEILTFQNINFTTNEAGHYFIDSNSTASTERYAHNVTVKNCDFTATEAGVNSAAAMRIRQGFNIAINGGTFNDLHSVLQAYGNAGITVDGITVNGKNGISAGTSTGVVVKNSNITATGYGVRADGTGAYDVTIKGTTTINAAMPVVVRKTNDGNGYNLTIADGVTLTTTGSGYQVTFTAGDDGEYVAPTAGATANFGNNSYTTFGLVAKIENEYYTTVDYAAAYATTTEGTQTIVLIDDAAAATNPLNVEVIDLNGKTLTADVLGTVVTNGGLWTTAAAPGYKMLGVGAEIYATAGATVINSQTEVNIVEGDVTLVPAEWWTLQGQSLIIGEHASFTIPTGSKFNVMNNTDVTINGTAINNGTLAIHPEATVNGNVAGNLQFLGGSYVTAEDHKMVGTTDDYHYNTTDALVNIALNGDITIAAGTMTLGHDWRTLPNQTVTVASAAAFIVPSNMTYQIYGTAVVEDGGTLTVNGTIELASLTATLTAEDGLNVTLIDELQNQGYDVDYSNGTYSVIEGMIWNKTQDKKYNSLQAAIDASSEGDEIIVLKDIKYTQDDIITVDVYGYTTMVNATGKNVVLDLNGHLVEADVKDYSGTLLSIIFVGDDGSLTLKDSSVEKTGAVKAIGKEDQANVYALIIADTKNTTNIKLYIESGTYELNKCTDGGALVYVNISNILTVTGGNFYLGNAGTLTNNSPWIFNTHSNGINNVIVKGGNYNVSPIQHYGEVVIPVEFAVTQTSDVTYPYSVVPAVARIDQTGYASIADAVNEANDGDEIVVTVSHTATVPAVVESNLTLNLNGKAITGDVYPVVRVQNGANVTVTGNGSINNGDYVFVLGASDGTSVGNLTIENGTFYGATTVASVTKGNLNITGGEFSVEPYQGSYEFLINCIDANYDNGSATVSISGGTFHKWNPENNAAEGANTNFCAPGHVAVYDAVNDTYTVIEANYVAQIGTVKYETLQAAIDAAVDGNEIDVVDNITLGIDDADQLCDNQYKSFFNVNGKTITIDLNGYTVKAILGGDLAANAVFALVSTENESNLTIKDSSDEKTGTMWIDNVIEVYSLVFQYDNSIVTIESGNYKLNVGGNGRGMIYSNDDEKVTVNGGNFYLGNVGALSNGSPWIFNASGQNTQNIIVNGGTFNADILHQYYPFEVMNSKEKALRNNGDGTWTMVDAVAYVDEQHKSGQYYTNYVGFATLEEAVAARKHNENPEHVMTVTLLSDIELSETLVVNSDVNYKNNNINFDFAEKEVTCSANPSIRIQGNVNVTVKNGNMNTEGYNFILGATDGSSAGNLTIESGKFHGATTVASVTKGLLTITGGDFSVEPYQGNNYAYLINCIDSYYNSGDAKVSISGGTFHNWNPQNNAAEGANTNFCADGYGAITNDNVTWTVIEALKRNLNEGWNWFSSYVEADAEAVQTALGENGLQIKSQLGFSQYIEYNGNKFWDGTITENPSVGMYMIKTSQAHEMTLVGNHVDPSQTPITIHPDWTWIAYPMTVETNISDAINFTPEVGDQIKGRSGFAYYMSNGEWQGEINTLVPGQGYMYHSKANVEKELKYGQTGSRSALKSNVTSENNYWVADAYQYANNMTMLATVDVEGGDYEVAAFVNGEVRGSSRPIYVESLDTYMLFLTIHGDEVEEMTFKMYDLTTGEEYAFDNRITYSDNAIVGSIEEPYMLTCATLGIGESTMSEINIYPNPTTIGREINLEATCEMVEVFNALGVKVAEYQNVDTIDAFETAGIYVIRITNNGDVKHCRLVVK